MPHGRRAFGSHWRKIHHHHGANTDTRDWLVQTPRCYAEARARSLQSVVEYFDPNEEVVYEKPSPFTFADVRPGATALTDLTATEKTVYAQLKTAYKDDLAQYQRYLKEQARLRTELMRTVSDTKKDMLELELTTREWMKALQTTTKPTDSKIEDLISARHRIFTSVKYTDWPSGGPDKWLSEWQKLMQDCKR